MGTDSDHRLQASGFYRQSPTNWNAAQSELMGFVFPASANSSSCTVRNASAGVCPSRYAAKNRFRNSRLESSLVSQAVASTTRTPA